MRCICKYTGLSDIPSSTAITKDEIESIVMIVPTMRLPIVLANMVMMLSQYHIYAGSGKDEEVDVTIGSENTSCIHVF